MTSKDKLDLFARRRRVIAACWVRRYIQNNDDVEEIVQDALLAAALNLESYREDKPFSNWIRAIIFRETYRFLRLRDGRPDFLPLEDVEGELAGLPLEQEIQTRMEQDEQVSVIMKAVNQLSEEQRFLVMACITDSLQMSVLTEQFQCNPQAVNARIHRAKRKVQDLLEIPKSQRRRPTVYAKRIE